MTRPRVASVRFPWAPSLAALLLAGLLTGASAPAQVLPLPPRATNAMTGRAFAQFVGPMTLPEREREIFTQVTSGNVPDFLRRLRPVSIRPEASSDTNSITFYVTPDYLAIGSDDDYLLMPMTPATAQRIADALHCSLPTRKMVDLIYAAADLKLAPVPIPPSPAMTTLPVFSNHNAMVLAQRNAELLTHPLGQLVAGHKKDLVITPRLAAAPGKVAIYGWHKTNGAPIQPLYLGHTAAWVDYSQCTRLVQETVIVNGTNSTIRAVLADLALSRLLSDEGPIADPRYPTDPPHRPPEEGRGVVDPLRTNSPGERVLRFELEPGVTVCVNAPAPGPARRPDKLVFIFYALPNGNSIDQTLGKELQPGDDWHYDIQHIAAQTRFLRAALPDRTILLACLEAEGKSWPAWRKQHEDKLIPGLLEQIKKRALGEGGLLPSPPRRIETVLASHSGGGSLIFGYLNAVDTIPTDVTRIAFLDSNYAYDRARAHDEKLAAWLKASNSHYLCVLAYHDDIALLDGKPFVSAAGGTWGRSHAMLADLAAAMEFTSRTNAGLEICTALDRRAQFLLKDNPERKILHTVQVERNGFIHSMLAGTSLENRDYQYLGPRAYTKYILRE